MWIIEATSKKGRKVYRTDRRKYPNIKWSYDISHAFQYEKEEIANLHCSRYQFGSPRVRELDDSDMFIIGLGRIFQDIRQDLRECRYGCD